MGCLYMAPLRVATLTVQRELLKIKLYLASRVTSSKDKTMAPLHVAPLHVAPLHVAPLHVAPLTVKRELVT